MKNPPNLSVVVLTQNEADNITRCLKSILWVGDVVIVDNSEDNTLALAKKLLQDKLQIIKDDNDNFAILRNRGLLLAKNDWVLYVDADEEVTPDLKQEIQIAIQDNDYFGFMIPRNDFFLGKWLTHGETAGTKLLKLGRKNKGKWHRRVHEVWKITGKVGVLKQPLLHYPHPSVAEFLKRINRWTTLDAAEFHDQGAKSSFITILLYPTAKFIKNYILSLGFLDGMPGLILALMMSFHSFLTRAKLYMLDQTR